MLAFYWSAREKEGQKTARIVKNKLGDFSHFPGAVRAKGGLQYRRRVEPPPGQGFPFFKRAPASASRRERGRAALDRFLRERFLEREWAALREGWREQSEAAKPLRNFHYISRGPRKSWDSLSRAAELRRSTEKVVSLSKASQDRVAQISVCVCVCVLMQNIANRRIL